MVDDGGMYITGVDIVGGNQALLKAVQDKASKMKKFQSYNIAVTSDHAAYVEYGTFGAVNAGVPDEFGRKAKESIYEWVDRSPHFVNLSQNEKRDAAYAIYRKIMTQGMTAYPYMRPAVRETLRAHGDFSGYFKDHTMRDLVEEIVERMKRNLKDHYFSGELERSIQITESNDDIDRDPSLYGQLLEEAFNEMSMSERVRR